MSLRLKHGMFWKYRYPGPWDYKQETRFIGALLLILFMLYLAASSLEFEALHQQEKEDREWYQRLALDCANQTLGQHGRIIWRVGDRILTMECQDWGSTEGIKQKI